MIRVNNITKSYDNFKALDGLTLHVRKGTVYGLVGANGAGKTTLLNHMNGVLCQDSGEVLIDGEPVFENEKIKKRVLSIADEWFSYASYNVKQMAKLYEDLYPSFSRERYEKIKEVFSVDEKRQIRKFSKGMKKQVAFLLALSCMPDVLILDEPLDGLDPVMRKQVLSLVIQEVAERETTVIVSSHNLRELEDICDWVGIIHQGKMVAEKPLDDIKGNVQKYQMLLEDNQVKNFEKDSSVLHISKTGVIYTVIIRGEAEDTYEKMKEISPKLCERVNLTLEEVFIYELEGLGYDYKNILL